MCNLGKSTMQKRNLNPNLISRKRWWCFVGVVFLSWEWEKTDERWRKDVLPVGMMCKLFNCLISFWVLESFIEGLNASGEIRFVQKLLKHQKLVF